MATARNRDQGITSFYVAAFESGESLEPIGFGCICQDNEQVEAAASNEDSVGIIGQNFPDFGQMQFWVNIIIIEIHEGFTVRGVVDGGAGEGERVKVCFSFCEALGQCDQQFFVGLDYITRIYGNVKGDCFLGNVNSVCSRRRCIPGVGLFPSSFLCLK